MSVWGRLKNWVSKRSGYVIVASLVAALAISVIIGFEAAPAHREFSWPLAGVAATAFGTLALAGYTASLATSTRREVAVALDEQRSRDRPVVVVTVLELAMQTIEVDTGRKIPVLLVLLRNVGVAPALDIRLTVSGYDQRSQQEVVPVLAVDETLQVSLSLTPMKERDDGLGFRLFDLSVEGDFADRRQDPDRRNLITIINSYGLSDELRAGAERTSLRAWPYLNQIDAPSRFNRQGDDGVVRTYSVQRCSIGNTGQASAMGLRFTLVDAEGKEYIESQLVGDVLAQGKGQPRDVTIELELPYPDLQPVLSFQDGDGFREDKRANIWPAQTL
jgi:hypothetical protein